MTIDTACSSSLVALHLAVQSLRNGESDVAVVAGTNLMLSFEPFIAESTMHMLSPTSRSRMWDAQADGYARGEGFAVVVLSSLDRAIQNHDPIRSIIRESLVNTDGRTTGLTVPNAAAQAALIRATYQRAGLDCQREQDRCQYFEAHGTGTPTGDPIEAEAIATAFFPLETSSATSLYVGSIKTVVGHLEGCAGLAGVLKASIAVEKGVIPPNLHFQKLNPAIEPFYQHLKIPLAAEPWPELAAGAPRRASVNSFGFGGAK
jgi:acyl transferase domain-containing protein